jgi:hypothetical protein
MMRHLKGGSQNLKRCRCGGSAERSTAWMRSSTMPQVVLPERLPPRKSLIGSRLLDEEDLPAVRLEAPQRVALVGFDPCRHELGDVALLGG